MANGNGYKKAVGSVLRGTQKALGAVFGTEEDYKKEYVEPISKASKAAREAEVNRIRAKNLGKYMHPKGGRKGY